MSDGTHLMPHEALSLEEVLRAALLQNPELSATAFEVHAAEARTLQAGLFPNPEIELELEDFGGTGEVQGVQASESTFAAQSTHRARGQAGEAASCRRA